MELNKIFRKNNNIIIGAIHFPPLTGYVESPGLEIALKNALEDLRALENGGVDAVIIENNYDVPHKIFVNKETVDDMLYLGEKVKKATNLPIGVSVLWNDYKSALKIAKELGLNFIRVPVFVDDVESSYGRIIGNSKEIIKYRKDIKAENVAIFTDIHVKHSEILSKYTITESAKLAIKNGSDALIVTGKWTGDAPDLSELKNVRDAVSSFPIFIGSGADSLNILSLLKYANGAIVSTSLKEGSVKKDEVNIKGWEQRISLEKVRNFIKNKNS